MKSIFTRKSWRDLQWCGSVPQGSPGVLAHGGAGQEHQEQDGGGEGGGGGGGGGGVGVGGHPVRGAATYWPPGSHIHPQLAHGFTLTSHSQGHTKQQSRNFPYILSTENDGLTETCISYIYRCNTFSNKLCGRLHILHTFSEVLFGISTLHN